MSVQGHFYIYVLEQHMAYKPLVAKSGSDCGFLAGFAGLRHIVTVAEAVVMWELPQGFPRSVGRVESRLYGFPPFPHFGISMACSWFVAISKSRTGTSKGISSEDCWVI
jgi:hypothetical protein